MSEIVSKYYVAIIIDASNSIEVEADSPEQAAEAAYNSAKASPRLCHQCSDDVELGEAVSVVVYDESGMTELYSDDYRDKDILELRAEVAALKEQLAAAQPRLTVKLIGFPESNGKRNWTAMIARVDAWGGLVGNCGGITVARGEMWNRVAYAAERTKFLIGERSTEPHILDYGDDIATPDLWAGEVRGGFPIAAQEVKS